MYRKLVIISFVLCLVCISLSYEELDSGHNLLDIVKRSYDLRHKRAVHSAVDSMDTNRHLRKRMADDDESDPDNTGVECDGAIFNFCGLLGGSRK